MMIKKGQRAPFAGQLFSHNAAAKLQAKIIEDKKKCTLALDQLQELHDDEILTLKERHELELDFKTTKLQLEVDLCEFMRDEQKKAHRDQTKLWNDSLDELANPPVYKTNTFWGIVGTSVGAILMFLVMK
jgi:hypothetical protein